MNPNLEGRWFRSESFTYGLGTTFPVKTDFLAQARHMAAPEVAEIVLRFTGTVGAVTGGALGRDAAKLYDSVRFTDEEEVINCSGAGLRVVEQLEFGSKQRDPADITSGSTNTAYVHRLRITFEPLKALRSRDTRIRLEHFLEGGEFLIQTASALPTGWAAVQADQRVRVYARVVDGRTKELKSRMTIREQAVTNQEFDYEVNGSIRAAILTSKLATTGYTTLAPYTTFFSRTMEVPPNFETDLVTDRYVRFSDALGTNDEFLLAAPGAIPLIAPNRFQKIGEMIDAKTLHLDLLQAAPTSGRLITIAIKNRTPNLSALVAGFGSVDDLQVALADRGKVVDGTPGGTDVTGYHPTLVRRLPVRV
jgi:hypothetical protein